MDKPRSAPHRRQLPIVAAGRRLSRRSLLGSAAAAGGGAALAACTEDASPESGGDQGPVSGPEKYGVPDPPEATPDDSVLRFFTPTEARELDALLGVVLPGDPDDPGAREAGVLVFIDYALGTYPDGRAERSYSSGPYAEIYTGRRPPSETQAGPTVPVAASDASLYGGQSSMGAKELMRLGLSSLGRYSRRRFGDRFSALSDQQQEQIVGSLFKGTASEFDDPSPQTFATAVREWIVQGMFSDPSYGGNRDLAGWKLVGYPGPQRAYTPKYLLGLVPELPTQTLADLHHFNAGEQQEPGIPGKPVLPVGGSRNGYETEEYQGR